MCLSPSPPFILTLSLSIYHPAHSSSAADRCQSGTEMMQRATTTSLTLIKLSCFSTVSQGYLFIWILSQIWWWSVSSSVRTNVASDTHNRSSLYPALNTLWCCHSSLLSSETRLLHRSKSREQQRQHFIPFLCVLLPPVGGGIYIVSVNRKYLKTSMLQIWINPCR